MVVLLVLLFAGIIWLEAPGLVRAQKWRELAVFAVLLVTGMILSIPQALGITLPNPNRPFELLFKPLTEWLQK